MAGRHVDALFSDAYDAELDAGVRRRFEEHLAVCSACQAAWADFRRALDAVRTLPAAVMPATVRLPAGDPRSAPSPLARWRRRWSPLGHPRPALAAAGMAACGILVIALAVHHGQPTTAGAPAGGETPLVALGRPGLAPRATCTETEATVGGGGGAPAGFAYATHSAVGSGQELVLATTAPSYPAGTAVPIFARLTGAAPGPAGSAVVPCVTLETLGSRGAATDVPAPAAPAPGAGGGRVPAPAGEGTIPPAPVAVATAAPASSADDAQGDRSPAISPLLRVVIPAGLPRGTVLRLVAVIPADAPGNHTGMPLEAELLITVS
jgi:predicted anti-sigma-YlaC factor YlaD